MNPSNQASTSSAAAHPFSIVETADAVPERPDPTATWFVANLELAELLVARGVSSSRICNAEQGDARAWARSMTAAGCVPPAPFDPGMRCLVVLPTYDERENLAAMIDAIGTHLITDVLIVDDNSPDGTGELADRLAADRPELHVMHRPGKLGLGTAYVAGFRWGLDRNYERIIEIDCDFSHSPRDLSRLVAASRHADLVIGSRFVPGGCTEGWVLRRRLLSRGANLYTKMFLGRAVNDWTGGFRCYRGATLAALDLDRVTASGYSFQIQMAWLVKRSGGSILEIPIHFIDRDRGQSKMSGSIAFEALSLVPTLRLRH